MSQTIFHTCVDSRSHSKEERDCCYTACSHCCCWFVVVCVERREQGFSVCVRGVGAVCGHLHVYVHEDCVHVRMVYVQECACAMFCACAWRLSAKLTSTRSSGNTPVCHKQNRQIELCTLQDERIAFANDAIAHDRPSTFFTVAPNSHEQPLSAVDADWACGSCFAV